MPRTTLDIDAPILRDLKRLQKREGKSLGQLASELLAQAIGRLDAPRQPSTSFHWVTRRMNALVDLRDKEAVRLALDAPVEGGAAGRAGARR